MSDDLLLQVQSVSKRFGGVQALVDVSLRIRPGTVHALCGGNGAGKSTVLNILMGILPRDTGQIAFKGQPVNFSSPKQALASGISIIQQELSPVLDMTVAENIFLGREPQLPRFFVNYGALNAMADDVLKRLHFDIDPRATMRSLSVGEMQLVEIAKAISHDAEIIIMDEPTSAIGEAEVEELFKVIRRLTEQGKSIIYVTHRLTEVFEIADEFTVFRDGRFITDGRIADIDRQGLIRLIIGGEIQDEFVKDNAPTDEVMLRVRDFTRAGEFRNINLHVNKGEILGIYGLMGSGRSEFFNCLFGIATPDSGSVEIDGKPLSIDRPSDAMDAGIALVTEDRKETGLVLSSSVNDNVAMSSLPAFSRLGFINRAKERLGVNRMVDFFRIRTPSAETLVRDLSGGNQQKVVLGRCLLTEPRILLLDEPTRGIDVGSKREMYAFMSDYAKRGGAAIMVSSEIPEILGMSDRIIVFRDGDIAGEIDRSTANQEQLVHLAS